MRNVVLAGFSFGVWCALVLAGPFAAFRFGALDSMEFAAWIAISYAATWRALLPPLALLVVATLAASSRRWPTAAIWTGGLVGATAGGGLMDQAMEPNAGQFDGLIVIVAWCLGTGAMLVGLAFGTWRKSRRLNGQAE